MKTVYDVLLAEDSDDDAFLFARAVSRTPKLRLLRCVRTGADAIAYLSGDGNYADRQQHPYPDLLVLDLNMPRLGGFEVLEWLRDQPIRPKVCVYAESAEPEDMARTKALGADCYISKGFALAQIGAVLRVVESSPSEYQHG